MRTKMDVIGTKIRVGLLPLFGHLECLKYAHENECPWDKETCSSAAESGHLECLKYAHENGCHWTYFYLYKSCQQPSLQPF